MGRYSVHAIFKGVDRVTAPVRRMERSLARFTRSARRGLGRVRNAALTMGRFLKRAFQVGAVAAFALGAAIYNIVSTGAEFGRAIGAAAAKFPEQIQRGTAAFRALEDAARETGRTTEFTSTQAAKGLEFFAKAGYTADFSMRALKPTVDFATATLLDFDRAADIASDTLGAFNLNADDAATKAANYQRVLDVITKTTASANLDAEQFFEAVKKGGPALTAAGGNLELFAAMVGTLADAGIKGSEAGVAVKNIAAGLAGVGNQASTVLRQLGISTKTEDGALRDQVEVLAEYGAALDKLPSGDRLGLLRATFGRLSLASAEVLLQNIRRINQLRDSAKAAEGTTMSMAAFIRDDVQGSLDAFRSAVDNVKLSIFSLNEGGIKRTIDNTTDWIRANEDLIASKVGDWLEWLIERLPVWARVMREEIIPTIFDLVKQLKPLVDLMVMAANIAGVFGGRKEGLSYAEWWEGQQSGRNFGEHVGTGQNPSGPQIETTGQYVARTLVESRQENSASLTIRDETGRAELSGSFGPRIRLVESGAM